jgi:hypothetical protein
MATTAAEVRNIRIAPAAFGPVYSVCAVPVGDATLLASAGYDGSMREASPSRASGRDNRVSPS